MKNTRKHRTVPKPNLMRKGLGSFFIKLKELFWPARITDASLVTVLIIEGSPKDVSMIKKAVAVCGFSSIVANDGKTGVEMAQKHKPNVVILDYFLSDSNGGQVLDKLRTNKETSQESVMVLSALDQPGIIVDSFAHGADQYLKKPITVSLLAKQIRDMVDHPHEH